KTAYSITFIAFFILVSFIYLRTDLPNSVVSLALFSVPATIVFTTAVYLSTRRFGAPRSGLPALIASALLVASGILFYSAARRPFRLGQDSFEPNLVFLFAPQYLLLSSVFLSLLLYAWAWKRQIRN